MCSSGYSPFQMCSSLVCPADVTHQSLKQSPRKTSRDSLQSASRERLSMTELLPQPHNRTSSDQSYLESPQSLQEEEPVTVSLQSRHLWTYAFPHREPQPPEDDEVGLPRWWLSQTPRERSSPSHDGPKVSQIDPAKPPPNKPPTHKVEPLSMRPSVTSALTPTVTAAAFRRASPMSPKTRFWGARHGPMKYPKDWTPSIFQGVILERVLHDVCRQPSHEFVMSIQT